jgi:ribonuclease M5
VDIYVLGSATKTSTASTQEALRALQQTYARVVLLLDPDVAGRQARNDIDRVLGGNKCWHAFIPTALATLAQDTRYKEQGDVGVEHAGGEAIRRAILQSKPSRFGMVGGKQQGGEERTGVLPFDRQGLIDMGLVAEMGVRGGDVTRRREMVCRWLGLGTCDGKQLLRQLNTYGFEREDLERALAYAREALQDEE